MDLRPPHAVSFKTAGPGDGILLELAHNNTVEIQARKGLRADRRRFKPALDALCQGIDADQCGYGILIVCPHSSIPVRQRYALALLKATLEAIAGGHPAWDIDQLLPRGLYANLKLKSR